MWNVKWPHFQTPSSNWIVVYSNIQLLDFFLLTFLSLDFFNFYFFFLSFLSSHSSGLWLFGVCHERARRIIDWKFNFSSLGSLLKSENSQMTTISSVLYMKVKIRRLWHHSHCSASQIAIHFSFLFRTRFFYISHFLLPLLPSMNSTTSSHVLANETITRRSHLKGLKLFFYVHRRSSCSEWHIFMGIERRIRVECASNRFSSLQFPSKNKVATFSVCGEI